MKRTVSATEARIHFGELMRGVVDTQEPVIVERGGKPQIVIVSIDHYERLRDRSGGKEPWQERLEETWAQIRREGRGRLDPRPEEVIRDMREERDAQVVDGLR